MLKEQPGNATCLLNRAHKSRVITRIYQATLRVPAQIRGYSLQQAKKAGTLSITVLSRGI